MKVAVLGAGAWGTALAQLLAEKGDAITLWSRRRELCDALNDAGENARYLPGIKLSKNISCTTDMTAALRGAEMIVFVVPSHATREVAREAAPLVADGALVVSATKGIENDSLMFMDEVLAAELETRARTRLAFLSGPSFARELAVHLPTAVVIAAHDPDVASRVMRAFHT
ncbi:MAG: 2-dehydropantoate 2-reductase N-terminal domain-containing protein, partial [Polyangiaceae bacterium]